jgi:chaperonin GroES
MSGIGVTPLGERVVVKPVKLDGTLISLTEKPDRGIVKAAPQNASIKEGDTIIFDKNAGMNVKIDNVDHLLMWESDILAIIN